MSTLSPACADAFGLLREDLYIHLEEADCLATQDGEWSGDDIQTARAHQRSGAGPARIAGRAPTTAHRQLPDLYVGMAVPGGDLHSRHRQGSGTPVRRNPSGQVG